MKKDLGMEEQKKFYRPPAGTVVEVDVPKRKFLTVDGEGSPEGETFQLSVQAMYGMAYTLKFRSKLLDGKDYRVMPLEGLWWMKGGGFDMKKREKWLWTLMIPVPDFTSPAEFEAAAKELERKKHPALLGKVHLREFEEGYSVQTMHVGPYADEPMTIARLDAYSKDHGLRMRGKHHEIYLGDPRRTAPERLKTILRHPVSQPKARS